MIREQTKLRIEVSKETNRKETCSTETLAEILARVLAEQSIRFMPEKQTKSRSVRPL